MGFGECDEVMAGNTFFALENDGDTATVVFVGEPIPREEEYMGKPRHRAYFPIVTKDGLRAWGLGGKLYRRLRDAWGDYFKKCHLITRMGAKGSTETTYGFKAVAVPKGVKAQMPEATPKLVKAFLAEVQTFGEDSP